MKIKVVLLLLFLCVPFVRLMAQSDYFFYDSYSSNQRVVKEYASSGSIVLDNFEVEKVPTGEGTLALLVCGISYVVLKRK